MLKLINRNILDSTLNKFGKLDILVNNAGVIELGSIENTSMEQYDRVMGINIRFVVTSLSFSVSKRTFPTDQCITSPCWPRRP